MKIITVAVPACRKYVHADAAFVRCKQPTIGRSVFLDSSEKATGNEFVTSVRRAHFAAWPKFTVRTRLLHGDLNSDRK